MADDSLHIDITADGAGATSAFSSLESRLAALEEAFKKSGSGAKSLAHESSRAEIAAKEAGGAFQKLSGFLEDVGTHSRTASMALNQVGLSGEAAVAKVEGLTQLFSGFGAAVPQLLAIGAAVAAIGASFEFVKDAAEKAAEWQHQMAILGATVRDQGGNWGRLSDQVEKWADAQERTTEFSRDEAVKALTTLTSTGMKLGDAMRVTRVAEDAAAATGRSLTEINFALSEAMHGRTQALTQLGLGTKASIKDGMKFSTVLDLIEQHMGGAAASAADTYQGKLTQLHNAFDALQENIGMAVLPMLTSFVTSLHGMIEGAQTQVASWRKSLDAFYQRNKQFIDDLKVIWDGLFTWISTVAHLGWDAVVGIFRGVLTQLENWFDLVADLFTGHWGRIWDDVKSIASGFFTGFLSAFGTFGDNLITITERVTRSIGRMFAAMWHDIHSGHFGDIGKDVASAFAGDLSGLKSWSLGGGGSHPEEAANRADIAGVSSQLANTMVGGKGPGNGNKAHAQMLKDISAEVQALDDRRKMGQITYGEEEEDIRKILASHKLSKDERQKWENKLTSLYQEEASAAWKVYDAEQKSAEAAQKRAGILASSQMQMVGQTGAIMAKRDQENLKVALAGSDKILRSTITGIADNTVKTAEALKKLAEQQQKLYNQQQRYLSSLADEGAKVFDDIFSSGKKGVKGFGDLFKETIKDIEHALEKSLIMQLLGGALGMKTNFGANFAGALGHGSSPLAGMFGSLMGGGPGGGGGSRGSGAAANASSSGVFGVVLGPSASAQAASSLPTDSLTSFMFGVGAPQVNGGGAGGPGGAGGALSAIGGAGGAGGVGGAAAIIGADATGGTSGAERMALAQYGFKGLTNMFKGGLPGISRALGFGRGSILGGSSGSLSLGGAALGVGAGALFGNLWSQGAGGGSHSTWGEIGGGVGGFLGGPVGGLIGAGIGSIFGHADNPHDMPDKYDTQRFGQDIANLVGGMGANGQGFVMDSTLASIVGTNPITGASQAVNTGTDMSKRSASGGSIAFIEETLAKYGSADKAPAWLQPLFGQLVSMFGQSATGSGQLNFGHHLNNETITGASGASGQTFQYTDIADLAGQFFDAYMQQGATSTSTSVNKQPGNGQGTGSNNPFQIVDPFGSLPVYNVGSGMPVSMVPYTGAGAGGPGEIMHGAPIVASSVAPPVTPANFSAVAKALTTSPVARTATNITVNVTGSLITQSQIGQQVGSAISGAKWQSPFASQPMQWGLDNA